MQDRTLSWTQADLTYFQGVLATMIAERDTLQTQVNALKADTWTAGYYRAFRRDKERELDGRIMAVRTLQADIFRADLRLP